MTDIAPYPIDSGYVELPEAFLLPICTTRERYDMMISALLVGGEILYGEDEILHVVDFLNALPSVREDCNVDYADLVTAIEAAQETADSALALATIARSGIDRDWRAFVDEATVIGETPTYSLSALHRYNWSLFTANAGTGIRWFKALDLTLGGTFYVLHQKYSTGGVSALSVNGTNISTMTFYNATALQSQLATFTLAASVHGVGRHQIDLTNSNVGTGGGRGMSLTAIWYKGN